jgi:hypothetical protein
LLRAWWRSALVDVGPEQVLGPDEGTCRGLGRRFWGRTEDGARSLERAAADLELRAANI